MADIHSNIYKLRKLNKMTLEELGAKVGTTKQTIKRYETGEIKSIPYDKIVALANALNTTPAEIMGWEEEKQHLTKDNAILLAQLTKAYINGAYLKKLSELPDKDKETIYGLIDVLWNATHSGEQQ